MPNPNENPLLEVSPYESDGGELIGRDPRKMAADEFPVAMRRTRQEAIRANCLECAGAQEEVRKCVASNCPMWPFRCSGTVVMVPESTRKKRLSLKGGIPPEGATSDVGGSSGAAADLSARSGE